MVSLGVRAILAHSDIANPTIIHAAILEVLYEHLSGSAYEWFGCRYKDWYELAMLSPAQYYKGIRALQRAKLVYFKRATEQGSSLPVVYHALGGKKPSAPNKERNAIVFQGKQYS